MLVTVDVPASVGLTPVETNVGAVRNSGVDFTVKWEDSLKDFQYGIRLTGTTIKTKSSAWEVNALPVVTLVPENPYR